MAGEIKGKEAIESKRLEVYGKNSRVDYKEELGLP